MEKKNIEELEQMFEELDAKFAKNIDEKTIFATGGSCGCGDGGSGWNSATGSPGW